MKKIGIGIDFSKKFFDATVMRRVEDVYTVVAQERFDNDANGFKEFLAWVRKSVKAFPEGKKRTEWIFCGENTGVCSAALSDFLAGKGYDMWLESALQINRKSGIVRDKNDRDDSMRIADYSLRQYESGKVRLHESDTAEYKKLSALLTAHDMLTKDKVAKVNQIKSGVLDCCPSALKLAKEQLALIEEQLEQIDREMEDMLTETEEFSRGHEVMRSFKGVGLITACYIIVATHNFKYMTDPRKLGNYIGVVPSRRKKSGDSIDTARGVSEYRDRRGKCLLTNSANSAIVHNPVIRDYHQGLLKRGVHPNKAKNNCKFKIINILLAMVRNDTPFDMEKYGKSKSQWKSAV